MTTDRTAQLEAQAIPVGYQLFEQTDGGVYLQEQLSGASVQAVKPIQANGGVGELCPAGEA